MLRLRTFGTVHVVDPAGLPLTGAAGQRRVLAFLTVLAVAGDGGLSREKVAALLWPEADTDRARHSVTQALYACRRALGIDDLFETGSDIRLNRRRLATDVQEFETALVDGELERAAVLYEGPFLDGFFLPGSPDFEQWVSTQRGRLEDRAVGTLVELARRAADVGDARGTVEWRKRVAAIRPLDAGVATDLMTALARAGDRAGAIRHADVHAALLRQQLGIDPDPSVTGLAARLREPVAVGKGAAVAAVATEPPVGPTGAAVEEPAIGEPTPPPAPAGSVRAAPVVAAAGGPVADSEGVGRDLPPARRRVPNVDRRWAAGGVLVLLLLAAGLAITIARARRAPPPAPVAQLRQTVVVAPFRVAGASEALAYLRDGLVELLSARLADDSAARSVDAGAVLSAWRQAGLARDVDVPRDTVVRLAERLGARRVVIGSVVGTRSRVILSATVVTVPDGAVTGTATVEGPADSVTTLVDRLAAGLLVQAAGEDGALAGQTTESLPALRAFLVGQAAFRGSRFDDALRAYERALQQDSTFALAALQLVRTADRLESAEDRSWALAVAWRGQRALSERDRAQLVALAGPRYPEPSPAVELLAAWERPVQLAPERGSGWYELGARLFHDGEVAGVRSPRARAAFALRRAIELDTSDAPARLLLAHLAAGVPPEPAAGPLPGPAALRDSTGQLAPFILWRAAVARGDSAALRRVRDAMPRLGRTNLRAIAQAAQFDGAALTDARRAVGLLRDRAVRSPDRQDAAEAAHALALNEGRVDDAARAVDELAELRPGGRAHLRLRVLDALYGGADRTAGEAAARELGRLVETGPGTVPTLLRAEREADACVVGQWRLAADDTAGVARLVAALEAARPAPAPDRPVVTPPGVCAGLLDAALAVTLRRRDAAARVAHLDSLALTAGAAGDAIAYAPILVARLHERLGDARGALAAVRRRAYMVGWPRYQAAALRDEGRYAALAGEVDAARAAYLRFLALRAGAPGTLAGEAREVRAALDQLAEPPPTDERATPAPR